MITQILLISILVLGQNKKDSLRVDTSAIIDIAEKSPEVLYSPRVTLPKGFHTTKKETVWVQVLIDTSGIALRSKVFKTTNTRLNEQALKLLKQYKFSPGEIGRKKVRLNLLMPIYFNP